MSAGGADVLAKLRNGLKEQGARIYDFSVPQLRVGTLDSLLALSDDLVKLDQGSEGIVSKILRQFKDLAPAADDAMVVNPSTNRETPLQGYLTSFAWDLAQYSVTLPLKELTEKIREKLASLDEELKAKAAEYSSLKSQLSSITRKESGSLMVRSLVGLIPPKAVVETEYLTTLVVCVPSYAAKDWLKSYESMGQFVVPESSALVAEDKDYSLFTVTLFRKFADEYKTACRENKFTVREYNAAQAAETGGDKTRLEAALKTSEAELFRFSRAALSEGYTAWIHLKAIRIFVESILRYGLPPTFKAAVIAPNKKNENKHHELLRQLAGPDTASSMFGDDGDFGGSGTGSGSTAGDFYPYVFTRVEIVSK